MKSSDKDMVMFRNSRKGYDKNDVNRYIEDMNIRFTTAENRYVSTIRMLERDLENARSIPNKSSELERQVAALTEEIKELKAELARTETELSEARKLAESIPQRNDAQTSAEISIEQAESKLGSILVKANLDAQKMISDADAAAKEKIAEAEAKAEAIRFEAAVNSRLMAENTKKELAALTEEYKKELTALSEESVGEYKRVSEDMKARIAIAEATAKAKLNQN